MNWTPKTETLGRKLGSTVHEICIRKDFICPKSKDGESKLSEKVIRNKLLTIYPKIPIIHVSV